MTKEFKTDLLNYCSSLFQKKLDDYQTDLEKLNESYNSETKSSAGDKYETAREMIHIEKGKIVNQINLLKKSANQLQQILTKNNSFITVENGALLVTNEVSFLIGVALGEVNYKGNRIFCISAGAPIAQTFLGKQTGDKITFNQKSFLIEDVL